MNISRTVANPKTLASRPTNSQATRPPHERWYVGEDVFNSTSEMLESGRTFEGANAVYHYASKAYPEEYTAAEKKGQARKFGLIAGGIGLGLTTLIGGIMISEAAKGYMNWGPALTVAGGMLGGTAALATLAGTMGYNSVPEYGITSLRGVVKEENGETNFYVRGNLENKVALEDHVGAKVPEADKYGRRDYGEMWWNKVYSPSY